MIKKIKNAVILAAMLFPFQAFSTPEQLQQCALIQIYHAHNLDTSKHATLSEPHQADQITNQPKTDPHNFTFYKGAAPNPGEAEIAKSNPMFKAHFSGYVKPEFFWDSRQVFGGRDDQTLLYPEPKWTDRFCRDANAHPSYDMLAIESRVRTEIIGPAVLGAHSNAYMEVDFYGINNKTINLLRMRHCYFELNWGDKKLLLGQYWHPLYTPECAPETLAGNSGTPMDPYKRAPQARFTKKIGRWELILTALSEINFVNDGPKGPCAEYMRNGVIPNLSARLQTHFKKHIFGITTDFKRLVPRLKSDLNVKVEESIYSQIYSMYSTLMWQDFTFHVKTTYANNGADFGLIGGYAVNSIQQETDKRTYTNLRSYSIWTDFHRTSGKIIPGCFLGYAKNLGASKPIIHAVKMHDNSIEKTIYALNTEYIDWVFRIQPRVRWFVDPVVFGVEIDYTRASYGQPNIYGRVQPNTAYDTPTKLHIAPGVVSNMRFLLAAYYYF